MTTKGYFCRILTKHSYAGKTLKGNSDQHILEAANEGYVFTTFTNTKPLCSFIHVNEVEATESSVKRSLQQQMHLTLYKIIVGLFFSFKKQEAKGIKTIKIKPWSDIFCQIEKNRVLTALE